MLKVSGSGLMLGTILLLHGGTEEDLKTLSQDNQPLGSDLNWGPPKHEELRHMTLIFSVRPLFKWKPKLINHATSA
jgi:hypothetical protein